MKIRIQRNEPPGKVRIHDARRIDSATGISLTDKNRHHAVADRDLIENIIKEAHQNGIDPYTALSISLQETGLGNGWRDNPFHLSYPQTDNVLSESMQFLKGKLDYAGKLGKKTEAEQIQAWNGYGKVTPSSELGGNMYYGIDVSKTPLDMNTNPVYGKRIIDLRDNVIKKNPEIAAIVQSYFKQTP